MRTKCKITLDQVNTTEAPEVLIAKGYRCVSRAYCMVARVDRADWLEVLAKHIGCAVADFYRMDGGGVSGMWASHYRRVYSKDVFTVHPDVVRCIPTSDHDPVGYIPKEAGDRRYFIVSQPTDEDVQRALEHKSDAVKDAVEEFKHGQRS